MSSDAIKRWNNFFSDRGIAENIKEVYLSYITLLLTNNVPIIFDFKHLSLLLGRESYYLASVINCPDSHYRFFDIKKRTGGVREICVPYPALLEMQYWILDNILKNIKIHPAAHGFVRKKSILTNANIHLGQKQLLKLDLKDFFPSIGINRIIYLFKSLGYPNQIAFYLARICSYDDNLPQGAPTSPMISNIIARVLDSRLMKFSKHYGLKYTRYADDLVFSGDEIPYKFVEYISNIIKDEGFSLNEKKTKLYKDNGRRIVTGISISSDELKIPREYKRKIRQELFYIKKFGFKRHLRNTKDRKISYLLTLLGKVNFWLSVEPNNLLAQSYKSHLIILYKEYFSK